MAGMELPNWTGAKRPDRVVLDGRYARLEPLDAARHGEHLLASAMEPGAEDRFRYLAAPPPTGMGDFTPWLLDSAKSTDPLFYAVIDKATGRAEGRQAFMRIEPAHGSIEIGNVLWGPAIARSRVPTEGLYLFARHAFEVLGYRRFEWKCNTENEASRRAALRFRFTYEGVFRQHMVVKGRSRDTAWFSMLDSEWPRLKAGYEKWLAPENFDSDGRQRTKLAVSLSA